MRLYGVPQRAEYHPEVDTGVHIELVCDMAARSPGDCGRRLRRADARPRQGADARDVLPKHLGHEHAGLAPLRALCERLKVPLQHRDLARMACREHLNVHRLFELRDRTVHELLVRCDAFRQPARIAQLGLVCEADKRGRAGLQDAAVSAARGTAAPAGGRADGARGRCRARRPRRPAWAKRWRKRASARSTRRATRRERRKSASSRNNASRIGVNASPAEHTPIVFASASDASIERVVVSVPCATSISTPIATRPSPRATAARASRTTAPPSPTERVADQVFELVAAFRHVGQQQRGQQRADDHRRTIATTRRASAADARTA
jgi:hypothetical protein